MKKAQAVLAASVLAPAVALAFETVDTLPWPSAGRFPAYPADEARTTDLWAQAGLMRDNNLLRTDSDPQSDTVARAGVGFRHSQRVIGRQTLVVDARADYYSFDKFDHLDHLAYAGAADWRWEVGNNLAGSIALGRERRLADLGETSADTRTMVTLTRASASGGYLITPSLRLRAGVGSTWNERSTRADAETRATSATGALEYETPLGNSVGVEVRGAKGDARTEELVAGAAVDNDYTEREVALVATYRLTARLRADGRVGRTTRDYDELEGRDFEGTTWRVGGEWLPGNKTSLALAFYKEPRSIIDVGAGHVLVRGVTFGPSWAPTVKTVLSARLLREERSFEGDPRVVLLPGTPVRDETIHALRLGAGWEPARHWQLSLAYDRGSRDSNFAGRGYDFDAVTFNVAWRY